MKRHTPEDYGGLPDGSDASGAFNRMATAIANDGTGLIDVSGGLYRLGAGITLPGVDGLAVVGSGPATGFTVSGVWSPNINRSAVQTNPFGGVLASTTVLYYAGLGSWGAAVADASLFTAGNVIRIRRPGSNAGVQLNEIAYVAGASVFFVRPLPFDVEPGATVERMKMRRGLRLEGFAVYGMASGVEHNGLFANFERDAILSDLTFQGRGLIGSTLGSGLGFGTGLNNRVQNILARHCGTGGSNALQFYEQTGLMGGSIRSEVGSFGIGLTGCTEAQLSALQVHRDNARALKMHSCHMNTLRSVDLGGMTHTGLGFAARSCRNLIDGLLVRGAAGGQEQGIWFNGEGNTHNVVLGARVAVCPQGAVVIHAADTPNYVQLIEPTPDPIYTFATGQRVVTQP